MSGAVITVSTANRPQILDRCVAAAVARCNVAREAHWIVLDNSLLSNRGLNHEVVRLWRKRGLKMIYIDNAVEEEIANSLPKSWCRDYFTHLIAKPAPCRSPGVRNLALLTSLSLDREVLFFLDDDIVHRHERGGACFFHWCTNTNPGTSFVAAARKRGIVDMSYFSRLLGILERHDWSRFLSVCGISTDPESWYSPQNPLWKHGDEGSQRISVKHDENEAVTTRPKDVVSGQLMCIRDRGGEWLPFPSGYNEDINWSILQSWFHGTPLLQVRGVYAQHLPPSIGHIQADALVSQLVGVATTRVLRQAKAGRELSPSIDLLQDIVDFDLKPEVLSLLALEASIRFRAAACTHDVSAIGALSNIESALIEVKKRLKVVDVRRLWREWLRDVGDRRAMFSALHRNKTVRARISRALLGTSA